MHYFIDGYNLVFRLLSHQENLQSIRESIIQDLNKKAALLKLNFTIVFDATSQIGERTRSHYNHLEIIYTAEGETADDYILEEIKNSRTPEQETVVTSDKKLAWFVRNQSAHTESVEEFMLWLNRSYKKKLSGPKKKSLPSRPLHPVVVADIPPSDISTEKLNDYYAQIFETEWEEILKKEKNTKKLPKKTSRKPRRKKNPFDPPKLPEPDVATEMERWLKLFE